MISCLTITQPSRRGLVELAIGDFARQTAAGNELVVVHDGGASFDDELQRIAAAFSPADIRVQSVAAGLSLGALRNLSVRSAKGEFVCQWDDDDRHHPARLQVQYDAMMRERADFCFLVDQLHWFPASGELFWDDWNVEPYPLNLVQGTLFGRREAMPEYPDERRGEDTELLHRILRARHPIARLRDHGWAYVYVYHGGNVWSAEHHRAISRLKRYSGARLLAREALLRERWAAYSPSPGRASMPWEGGALVLAPA